MKSSKKILALCAVAVLALTALAGCSKPAPAPAPAATTAAPAATTAAPAATTAAPAATTAAAPAKPDYPTKGLYAICPWGAGGGTDSCLRAFAEAVGKQLGESIQVDNLTGGGGITGHQAIAEADPDGYTIGMITFELNTYQKLGTSSISYEDYDLICNINTDAAALSVNADWAKEKNITDLASFVEYAKAHPGEIKLGGAGNASVWHVAGGYMMQATGTEVQMIAYEEGASGAVKDAAGGFIQGVTVSLAEARSFLESGHLICLGVMDSKRNSAFQDVPTFGEQGYDVVYGTFRGIAGPKGLPADILEILRDACAKAAEDADFVKFMNNAGQTITYMNADEYAEFLKNNKAAVEESMDLLGL